MDPESNLVKSQNLRRNGRGGRDHGSEVSAELCSNLLEDCSIVELMIERPFILVIVFLGIDGLIK
jgi:hypothetical protein